MNKEEILRDFLNTLKISFKNASIYGTDHPAFSESISRLFEKINRLLRVLIPISIGFTSKSLYLDGRVWEKPSFFQDIASAFHFRKLKSIEITDGIMLEELRHFICQLSLSSKEVIKRGGPNQLLDKEKLPHIAFEELDYSELLKGTGEEIKDIWVVLLEEALEKQDDHKVRELADSFEKVIKAFETQNILESGGLNQTLSDFFTRLETVDERKYRKCTKEFIQTLMRSKIVLSELESQNLQNISGDFKGKDMAGTFWEEILTDNRFDSLNMNIFSQLTKKDRQEGAAHFIANIFRKNEALRANPQILEKMEELISDNSNPLISEVYRNTLAALLREITFEEERSLHNDILQANYRFMLINLLEKEKSRKEMLVFLQKLLEECGVITEKKDYECIKAIYDTLQKKKEIIFSEPEFAAIHDRIIGFIEDEILRGEISFYFDYFINAFEKSTLDVNVYLGKIFSERNITPYSLKAFFKFFKEYLFYFNINLEQYASDEKLVSKMLNSLRLIDSVISLTILKDIYHLGEKRIKIEVLRAMQNLTEHDTKFLLSILEEKDLRLRAEAFVILMRNRENRDRILKTLLIIPSPFGIKNKRLIKNIQIVEEKEVKEAIPYLALLNKRKHFWNKKLRKNATRVLEKWDAE